MSKRNKVAATVAGSVNVTSARDLAVQVGSYRLRGIALGNAALKICPNLAKDFGKGETDFWAEYDAGSRASYDASHVAPVLVRDEKGRYSVGAADANGLHVTAAYLGAMTTADWSKTKNDSPTLWTELDKIREKVNAAIRDNRRTLRTNVKLALGTASRGPRSGNLTLPEVITKSCEALRAKVKLELGHKTIDQSVADRVTAWIIEGEKLLKG